MVNMGIFGNSKKAVTPEVLDNIVTLTDQYGKDREFEYLDLISYENREFVVLLPRYDNSGAAVILEIKDQNTDEEHYDAVASPEELDVLFALFRYKFKDSFEFVHEL